MSSELSIYATWIFQVSGETLKLNINPFSSGNPMTLKDAVILSVLTATATYFLTFFVNVAYGQVIADPGLFVFDSVKIWMQAFWGNFIILFGIETYMKWRSE